MKKVLALMLVLAMALGLAACGGAAETTAAPATTDAPAASDAPAATTAAAADGPYEIAVIIKATSSDFWQYVLVGANNYGVENPDKVKITTYGPPAEADIDQQVSILEDVIASGPDAIVIASTSSDATVPAIEEAIAAGIPVITIDNRVQTDKVNSFLATDNLKAGGMAAEFMVKGLKEKYGDLTGKAVGVVSAMAGVQVLIDRDTGFADKIKELAPELTVLETRYVDNDMTKAMSAAEDMLTANDNLIGIFADNNTTGSGTSRVISQLGKADSVFVVAFDSDAEEVAGLAEGSIKALVLQDPFGMGYKGVDYAIQVLEGKEIPAKVDTGATLVTKDNMNDAAIKGLLDPYSLKK
jgi:ribose transport system substrate-binding protein